MSDTDGLPAVEEADVLPDGDSWRQELTMRDGAGYAAILAT
jgi:hypothetical protein